MLIYLPSKSDASTLAYKLLEVSDEVSDFMTMIDWEREDWMAQPLTPEIRVFLENYGLEDLVLDISWGRWTHTSNLGIASRGGRSVLCSRYFTSVIRRDRDWPSARMV